MVRFSWKESNRCSSFVCVSALTTVMVIVAVSARFRLEFGPLVTLIICVVLSSLLILPVTVFILFRLYMRRVTPKGQNDMLLGPTKGVQAAKLPHNMLNTWLTAAMIAFSLPVLYYILWAPDLVKEKIETTVDKTNSSIFPAVALLQDPDWSSQAKLSLKKMPKCFAGRWQDDLPICDVDHPGVACNCVDDWALPMKHFVWKNTTYEMLQLQPRGGEISTEPGQLLMLQAFFSYNAQQAIKDRGILLEPSLQLVIWDPHLLLSEALDRGLTRMLLINANALTAINLNVQSRQTEAGGPYAYDYGQSTISSIPSASLSCDTSNALSRFQDLCEVTLQLQYITFELTVRTIRNVMEWQDVLAEAGSWISLFQILAWVLSGLAVQT